MRTMVEEAPRPEAAPEQTVLQADTLRRSDNAAIARLADALRDRSEQSGIQAYSRTYHRHSRTHTRK
jgi:hypothetical protein